MAIGIFFLNVEIEKMTTENDINIFLRMFAIAEEETDRILLRDNALDIKAIAVSVALNSLEKIIILLRDAIEETVADSIL